MNKKHYGITRNVLMAIIILLSVFIGYKLGKINTKTQNIEVKNSKNKIDKIIELIEEKYVDKVSVDSIIEQSIPTILEKLDPHSTYIPAKDLSKVNEPLQGSFDGVGITFNMNTDTVIVINTVVGGPSERAGIEAGDRIIRVNDSVIAGRKIESDSIMKLLRGKAGTKVNLDVVREGFEKEIPFEITRAKIPLKSIDVSYMINDSIGFIKMSKFAKTTYREFIEAANKLNNMGMKKLILDLRDNTGGYLDQAFRIANEFFDKKIEIVYTEGEHFQKESLYSNGQGSCSKDDIIVLINESSASASEILAGAIQDNDRGIIVGRRSFGKGLVQEPMIFSDGSGLNLTIARYYTPTGRCIQKPYNKGIKDYNMELWERVANNELFEKDSIHFNKNLKFKTPKGKTVYGGGGIMPDVFVPLDTTGSSNAFLKKVIQKNLIYTFVMNFSDKKRAELNEIREFSALEKFMETHNIFDNFITFCKQKGIALKAKEAAEVKKILEPQLQGLIGRNTHLDDYGFYPYFQKIDETLNRAIKIFEK